MRRKVARLRDRHHEWRVAARRGRLASLAAVTVAVGLVLSGCSRPAATPEDPLQREPGQMYFYGADGNMSNGVGERVSEVQPDSIVGMKGTLPLTPITQSFRDRLRTVDPSLVDETYSGETYDAVVISALAAQLAGSTDPRAIAAQINAVTVGGEICDTPAQCLEMIESGLDIRYRGITLGLGGFTDVGEPSASTYGILRFGAGNRLAMNQTQYVPAGNPNSATQAPPPAGGSSGGQSAEALRIGALLPHTGSLASAGPPMFAAGILAVQEVNEAGGILGLPVVWVDGDDGTNADVAKATVTRLIEEEQVDVIIGAGASGVSLAVLPLVVEAGVVLFSPCNTSVVLTDYDDQGLYFRTAPPDGLQAAALADIIVRDGTRKLTIIYRDDAWGVGLAQQTKDNLVAAGLAAEEITLAEYSADLADQWATDPANASVIDQLDFTGKANAVRQSNPDGVVLVAFDETSLIVDSLLRAGVTSIVN